MKIIIFVNHCIWVIKEINNLLGVVKLFAVSELWSDLFEAILYMDLEVISKLPLTYQRSWKLVLMFECVLFEGNLHDFLGDDCSWMAVAKFSGDNSNYAMLHDEDSIHSRTLFDRNYDAGYQNMLANPNIHYTPSPAHLVKYSVFFLFKIVVNATK